jgi:hypothetical protein
VASGAWLFLDVAMLPMIFTIAPIRDLAVVEPERGSRSG